MNVFKYQDVNKLTILKAPAPCYNNECLVSEFTGTAIAEISSVHSSRSCSGFFHNQIFYNSQERIHIPSNEIIGSLLILSLTLQNIIKMIILLLNYIDYLTLRKNSFRERVVISVEKHKKKVNTLSSSFGAIRHHK